MLAAGLLAAPPALAAEAVPFAADSGDSCLRGSTEGTIQRYEGPEIRPRIDIEGVLRDEAGPTVCLPDDLHSRATFSGYQGDELIDTETFEANDGEVELSFSLSDSTSVRSIDRVVVRVCRHSNTPFGISYCGTVQEYKIP